MPVVHSVKHEDGYTPTSDIFHCLDDLGTRKITPIARTTSAGGPWRVTNILHLARTYERRLFDSEGRRDPG
jgi:hypothetical protein